MRAPTTLQKIKDFSCHIAFSQNQRFCSGDITGDKEEFLAEIPQILLPARACEVPLHSQKSNFP